MPIKERVMKAKVVITVGPVSGTISVTDMAQLDHFGDCLKNLFRDLRRQGTVTGDAAEALADPFDRFKKCVSARKAAL